MPGLPRPSYDTVFSDIRINRFELVFSPVLPLMPVEIVFLQHFALQLVTMSQILGTAPG